MYTLTYKPFLNFAVAGLFVLCSSGPSSADELVESLGPVAAHEPILTSLGDKRVIAFYTPGSERCALHAVVTDTRDVEPAKSAARLRINLEPGQAVHIDTVEDGTLNLQCGDGAKTLSVSDDDDHVAFGIVSEAPDQVMKAQASDF